MLIYQSEVGVAQVIVKREQHFRKERKIIIFYGVFFGALFSVECGMIIYAIAKLEDPESFIDVSNNVYSRINLFLTSIIMLWTVVVYLRFFVKSRRLYYDIHHKYNLRWTLLFVILLFSLLMIMFEECSTVWLLDKDYKGHKIHATSSFENILQWTEFFGFLLPPLALIFVAFPQDLYVRYNKFRE